MCVELGERVQELVRLRSQYEENHNFNAVGTRDYS